MFVVLKNSIAFRKFRGRDVGDGRASFTSDESRTGGENEGQPVDRLPFQGGQGCRPFRAQGIAVKDDRTLNGQLKTVHWIFFEVWRGEVIPRSI